MSHRPFRLATFSLRSLLALCGVGVLTFLPVFPFAALLGTPVQAATVDQLKAQQDALDQSAKKAEQQAQAQKSVAQRAADKVQQVSTEIGQIQDGIASANQKIGDLQTQIGQQNQQIAALESKARQTSDVQDSLIQELFMRRKSLPDILTLFSDEPVSKREEEQAQFSALKRYLKSVIDQTAQEKIAVQNARSQLQGQTDELTAYRDSQKQSQVDLADVQTQQQELQQNAEAAVVSLEAQAKQARIKEQQLEAQVAAAVAAQITAQRNGTASYGPGEGGHINQGQIVGFEGSTGFSTGPHVHFEVRVNGQATNPRPYVSSGSVSWPLDQPFVVTQEFGYTDYSSVYANSVHTGIDIARAYGSRVLAPCSGIVIIKRWYGGYGNAAAIDCDGSHLVVLMGHMQ
jgi:septal ring factor EnvC (AmiA/AmiB activator)